MQASDILGFDDLKTKVVHVDAWECDLTIRELALEEGVKLLAMAEVIDESRTIDSKDIAQVIAWSVIDPETGERMFSDDDVPALCRKNPKPLMFLYQEITSLSGGDAEKN